MLYLIIILVCAVLFSVFNVFVTAPILGLEIWFVIVMVVAYIAGAVAIDGLLALLVNHLPKKWFNFNKKIFTVSANEKKYYEKLKIRKWKDRVPELGQLANFKKNKIVDPKSNEYLDRYLTEACIGEVVHITGMIGGFLLLAVYPPFWLCFGLPVAVVNMIMNYPSYCILRYNTTKLRVLYEINRRKALKEQSV